MGTRDKLRDRERERERVRVRVFDIVRVREGLRVRLGGWRRVRDADGLGDDVCE